MPESAAGSKGSCRLSGLHGRNQRALSVFVEQSGMTNVSPQSWTGRMSPLAARLMLAGIVAVALLLVWVGFGIAELPKRPGPSDFDTYERVVTALRGGQDYYWALHQALLEGGYPTLSPLNWRPPVFLTFLSWFPTLGMAQMVLGALTAAAWASAVAYAHRLGGIAGAVAAGFVLALSLLSIVAPRAELSFELCAGTLILISVSAYGLGWRWVGIAAAVLALCVRELAAVYVIVCVLMAIRERRWREVLGWIVVVAAYGAFYLWHVSQTAALLGPADHAAREDWLQLGGLMFVLRTAAFNGLLLIAPYWVAGLVLIAGLVGLKDLPRPALTVAFYLLLFLAYGRPVNDYWGGLYAPLVAFGLVWAPGAVLALVRRATPRRSS